MRKNVLKKSLSMLKIHNYYKLYYYDLLNCIWIKLLWISECLEATSSGLFNGRTGQECSSMQLKPACEYKGNFFNSQYDFLQISFYLVKQNNIIIKVLNAND